MLPLRRRREQGIALIMVLVIGLLLTTVMAALMRRSIIDVQISRNRDAVAQAEALARGGIQLAKALLVADALAGGGTDEAGAAGGPSDAPPFDLSDLGSVSLTSPDGGSLSLRIEDEGTRLNLNALVDFADPDANVDDDAIEFLNDFFAKVIDEAVPPGEKALYDARDLARNLLDYVDKDDTRQRGGAEDDYYQSQRPAYRAPNRPLLTVDEIGMVEGFTPEFVTALRPYVTVHPLAGGGGINLNEAPAHVLAAVYHGNAGSRRLANEDTVRRILLARQDGQILCNEGGADDRCILVTEFVDGTIYPEVALPTQSSIFTVVAEASVGEVRRSIEAVIDRREPTDPVVLSWRTQ